MLAWVKINALNCQTESLNRAWSFKTRLAILTNRHINILETKLKGSLTFSLYGGMDSGHKTCKQTVINFQDGLETMVIFKILVHCKENFCIILC